MKPVPFTLAAVLALAPVAAQAQPGPFLSRQGPELWSAAKIVGIDVLGPDGKKVGDITGVLMDHDGRAAAVVIGVGGFLGLGQKDVALPFAQVHFTQEGRPDGRGVDAAGVPPGPGAAANPAVPAATPGAQGDAPAAHAALGGPVGTTAGVPGGQATGLAAMPSAPPGGTASSAGGTARPDHAAIDFTADQLKAAPPFVFAR